MTSICDPSKEFFSSSYNKPFLKLNTELFGCFTASIQASYCHRQVLYYNDDKEKYSLKIYFTVECHQIIYTLFSSKKDEKL